MRDRDWGIPALLLIYATVIGIPVLAVVYGVTRITVASELSNERAEREKTILEERIANAREIKQALARGVPPPEPLPPVTAKPAKLHESKIGGPEKPAKEPSKRKIPGGALNAMAMETKTGSEPQISSSAPLIDRAATAGW